jgi:hypothetical protein
MMLNYVKLYMIREKFHSSENSMMPSFLVDVIRDNPKTPFEKLGDAFYKAIAEEFDVAEEHFSDEELKELGITKTTKLGHKYKV